MTQTQAVTLYSQPNCQPCRAVKRTLDKRGITFTEVDASQDLDAYKYIKALGYQGTPVTVVSDGDTVTHFHGFDPIKLGAIE